MKQSQDPQAPQHLSAGEELQAGQELQVATDTRAGEIGGASPLPRSGHAIVITDRIHFNTRGNAHMVNITADVRRAVAETGLLAGAVTLFVPGATGAVTTLEFEPGVVQDFQNLFDRIAPPTEEYEHNRTHPDANGHAHVRAGLLGPSLVIPFEDGALCLGRWQEICFVCFDNRPRERTVIIQTFGVR